jgi:hypothetical protein
VRELRSCANVLAQQVQFLTLQRRSGPHQTPAPTRRSRRAPVVKESF